MKIKVDLDYNTKCQKLVLVDRDIMSNVRNIVDIHKFDDIRVQLSMAPDDEQAPILHEITVVKANLEINRLEFSLCCTRLFVILI